MPTSRSRKPNNSLNPAAPSRMTVPLIVIAVLAVLAVAVIALPASFATHFLPQSIAAEDFSGSIWHGSVGNVTVQSRNIGAVEWHLHPLSLLSLALVADLHWVKVGFVADSSADISSHGLTLHNLQGGGPIEDLRELGIADGWRGNVNFKFDELKATFVNDAANGGFTLASAVGDLSVADLSSPTVANNAGLGGYALHMANVAITPGADASAELTDTGGPLQVQATIHLSADGHTGMLTGAVKARSEASPTLHSLVDKLAQMHAPDAQGAIPVDLEFTL